MILSGPFQVRIYDPSARSGEWHDRWDALPYDQLLFLTLASAVNELQRRRSLGQTCVLCREGHMVLNVGENYHG